MPLPPSAKSSRAQAQVTRPPSAAPQAFEPHRARRREAACELHHLAPMRIGGAEIA